MTIHDAATREAIACLRTSPGAGGARPAHAAWPTPAGRALIVSNQNGKQIERIRADWETRTFTWEPEATLRLYEGTTPSGEQRQDASLRPDNAPICTRTTRDGRFAFVSLRGGGAFVIDHAATPMRIIAEYDRTRIDDNGCGQAQGGGTMYLNAGAGAPEDRFGHTLYAVDLAQIGDANPPNTPAPRVVYRRDGDVDAHGLALTKEDGYLLQADRIQNDVTVVDTRDERVLGRFSLAGRHSKDPAPDLVDLSPDDRLAFFALRGPAPLSGGQDAIGATPGLGVVELGQGEKERGKLMAIARVPRPVTDPEPPDPHAVGVRLLR